MEKIEMTRETFNTLAEVLEATTFGPDYNRSKVFMDFDFDGPKGVVDVRVVATAVLRDGNKAFYGRADYGRADYDVGWTHVELRDAQITGKGARSFYPGTMEAVYNRVWNTIRELVS